jgi:NADP-dependent 3-hydroxy acid dehydrogenase YdfG
MDQVPPRIGIVTGASRGIGKAILQVLIEAGHRVVINARGAADLVAVAQYFMMIFCGDSFVSILVSECKIGILVSESSSRWR